MLHFSIPSSSISFNLATKLPSNKPLAEQAPLQLPQDENKVFFFSENTSKLLLPQNSAEKPKMSGNSLGSQNMSPGMPDDVNRDMHVPLPSNSNSEDLVNGSEIWVGEAKYTGGFKGQMKHGYGVLQFRDGLHYTGQFEDDSISGYGVARWLDKTYEGFWKQNQKHGKGKETFSDGRKYIGDFRNDRKEGFGEFYWPNGAVFKGFFVNGKQHGEGEFINAANATPKRGLWENGKRVKWIEETPKQMNQQQKSCSKEDNSLSSNSSFK